MGLRTLLEGIIRVTQPYGEPRQQQVVPLLRPDGLEFFLDNGPFTHVMDMAQRRGERSALLPIRTQNVTVPLVARARERPGRVSPRNAQCYHLCRKARNGFFSRFWVGA